MRADGIESPPKLASRPRVLAHMLVCKGCCCGVTEKRNPPVPVEWLKQEWRNKRLSPITLTITEGCLGPCDLANVVCITSLHGVLWLGQIERHLHYTRLVDWANAAARTDALLPLPSVFDSHRFDRFRAPPLGFQKKQATLELQGFNAARVRRAGSRRTEVLH